MSLSWVPFFGSSQDPDEVEIRELLVTASAGVSDTAVSSTSAPGSAATNGAPPVDAAAAFARRKAQKKHLSLIPASSAAPGPATTGRGETSVYVPRQPGEKGGKLVAADVSVAEAYDDEEAAVGAPMGPPLPSSAEARARAGAMTATSSARGGTPGRGQMRAELFGSSSSSAGGGGVNSAHARAKAALQRNATNEQAQDEVLQDMSEALSRLKVTSSQISISLHAQEELLDEATDNADTIQGKFRVAEAKLDALLNRKGCPKYKIMFCLIFIAVVLFCLIIIT